MENGIAHTLHSPNANEEMGLGLGYFERRRPSLDVGQGGWNVGGVDNIPAAVAGHVLVRPYLAPI